MTKEVWNVTFMRKDGKWGKPLIYKNLKKAEIRMRWDLPKGMQMGGDRKIEVRRGKTRRGKLILQYIPPKSK